MIQMLRTASLAGLLLSGVPGPCIAQSGVGMGEVDPPRVVLAEHLDMDGASFSDCVRGDLDAGQVRVILLLVGTGCPPCMNVIPNFLALQEHLVRDGVRCFGVALSDSRGAPEALRVIQNRAPGGIAPPLVIVEDTGQWDPMGRLSDAAGMVVREFPSVVVLDGLDTVVWAGVVGGRDADTWLSIEEAALAAMGSTSVDPELMAAYQVTLESRREHLATERSLLADLVVARRENDSMLSVAILKDLCELWPDSFRRHSAEYLDGVAQQRGNDAALGEAVRLFERMGYASRPAEWALGKVAYRSDRKSAFDWLSRFAALGSEFSAFRVPMYRTASSPDEALQVARGMLDDVTVTALWKVELGVAMAAQPHSGGGEAHTELAATALLLWRDIPARMARRIELLERAHVAAASIERFGLAIEIADAVAGDGMASESQQVAALEKARYYRLRSSR